jgi:hypothetical protein
MPDHLSPATPNSEACMYKYTRENRNVYIYIYIIRVYIYIIYIREIAQAADTLPKREH